MYDENQTFVPESFSALYLDGRRRLTVTKAELAQRSEFCEDLANVMSGHCSTVHFRDGVDEATVLERCLAGLRHAESGVSAQEACWVTRRTAELLSWEWPAHLDASEEQHFGEM
ncbi:hypothetical protein [Methylibium sp. Root1272]|uniref:hypothetical protein n=1 Tax=Methylibium sp. Root1272 TaxID=1736441 RepID=UPI0006F1E373|nr:hypothetical protein [Methylibium sp. Root1272]KQW69829.1 hypothetical protein ASC67_04905 [Methylibium sp. Root1272]